MGQMLRFVTASGTDYLAGGGVYANLLDAHPPFQIDGNFGYTAGICEMLLQSHLDEIHLLPALPKAWAASGSVTGLKARGNVVVDMRWQDGKLVAATLHPKQSGIYQVRYGDKRIELKLNAGQAVSLNATLAAE
jgi:alpha-L-fucosidase 2